MSQNDDATKSDIETLSCTPMSVAEAREQWSSLSASCIGMRGPGALGYFREQMAALALFSWREIRDPDEARVARLVRECVLSWFRRDLIRLEELARISDKLFDDPSTWSKRRRIDEALASVGRALEKVRAPRTVRVGVGRDPVELPGERLFAARALLGELAKVDHRFLSLNAQAVAETLVVEGRKKTSTGNQGRGKKQAPGVLALLMSQSGAFDVVASVDEAATVIRNA
jgi:hypothetical protein